MRSKGAYNVQAGMFHRTKIAIALAGICVLAIATTAYFWAYAQHGPTSDEFAVFAAFLARVSADEKLPQQRLALADRTAELVKPEGEHWVPAALQPDPPEKAAPPAKFVAFCGAWCGRDFMRKNLREWRLKPSPEFPFDVVEHAQSPPAAGGKWVVSITRPGFDLWHHRAVLMYNYDCSRGWTPGQDAVLCITMGDVLLEKVNGKWQVSDYSAFMF